MEFKINSLKSHNRYNPLMQEWIIVSPNRIQRPWKGNQEELRLGQNEMKYDPECSFCPGNTRPNGEKNPNYEATYSFDNNYPFYTYYKEDPSEINISDLLIAREERGLCRVVCFSPRHDLTIPLLPISGVEKIVDIWCQEVFNLSQYKHIQYIQIFENKGKLVGCGMPHPHSQILASEIIPYVPDREYKAIKSYFGEKRSCLLCDYTNLEHKYQERIVIQNDHFLVVVPFWAFWPYETLLISKRHISNMLDLKCFGKKGLAEILKNLFTRYDNLFKIEFPYNFGFHQSPVKKYTNKYFDYPECHLHAHIYSPIINSGRQKYFAGPEMLATPIRDITPESSAKILRELPEIHYKLRI